MSFLIHILSVYYALHETMYVYILIISSKIMQIFYLGLSLLSGGLKISLQREMWTKQDDNSGAAVLIISHGVLCSFMVVSPYLHVLNFVLFYFTL